MRGRDQTPMGQTASPTLTTHDLLRTHRERRALDNDDAEMFEGSKYGRWDLIQRFFFQDYASIEGLIQNLTIMAALVATLGVTMVTIVELPEFPYGNMKMLAMSNRGFRCHFAPDNTLDVCNGNIDCSKGYTAEDFDPESNGASCEAGCNIDNLQVGYDLASDLDVDLATEWIERNWARIPYAALPSKSITLNGFYAVLVLMTSLFIAVFLYISLVFSHAREDPKELRRWWFPVGALGVFGSYTLLLYGCFYFFQALQEVVGIRFPFYQEYDCFVLWNMNFSYTVGSVLLMLIGHHIHTRIPSIASGFASKVLGCARMCAQPDEAEAEASGRADEKEELKKKERIGPYIRALFASASEDMAHCVPLFEQARVTPSQLDGMEKKDFLEIGLCVGDTLRVADLLKKRKEKNEERDKKRTSSAIAALPSTSGWSRPSSPPGKARSMIDEQPQEVRSSNSGHPPVQVRKSKILNELFSMTELEHELGQDQDQDQDQTQEPK